MREYETAATFSAHHANAFEDGDEVREFCRSPSPSSSPSPHPRPDSGRPLPHPLHQHEGLPCPREPAQPPGDLPGSVHQPRGFHQIQDQPADQASYLRSLPQHHKEQVSKPRYTGVSRSSSDSSTSSTSRPSTRFTAASLTVWCTAGQPSTTPGWRLSRRTSVTPPRTW